LRRIASGKSIPEILTFLEEVRGQIATVEHAGERMEELRKEQGRLAHEFEKLAADLHVDAIVAPENLRWELSTRLARARRREVWPAKRRPGTPV